MDRNYKVHIITEIPQVALRKESVDRNNIPPDSVLIIDVALRKESVDRNLNSDYYGRLCYVALRKESVDRNKGNICAVIRCAIVALRKESVDRNKSNCFSKSQLGRSLSARRAWIEILSFGHIFPYNQGRSPQGERG